MNEIGYDESIKINYKMNKCQLMVVRCGRKHQMTLEGMLKDGKGRYSNFICFVVCLFSVSLKSSAIARSIKENQANL